MSIFSDRSTMLVSPVFHNGSLLDPVVVPSVADRAGYIDWLFTTPLLLVSLGVLAGLSPSSTMLAIFADIFMVVTGLFAGIRGSHYNEGERYKWGWYTVSCVGFLLIFYILITGGSVGKYPHPCCLSGVSADPRQPPRTGRARLGVSSGSSAS